MAMSSLEKALTFFKYSIYFCLFLGTLAEARMHREDRKHEENHPPNHPLPPPPPPSPHRHNYNSRQWHHQLPLLNRKNYMKLCNTASDCPLAEGLICNMQHDHNSRCMCAPSSRYDAFSRQCIEERPCSEDTNICLEENSICLEGWCQCKPGYAHDRNSDSCTKLTTSPSRPVFSSFLSQNIFTIVIVCNFLLWLFIFVFILQYIKRRRLAAAAVMSAHSAQQNSSVSGRGGRAATMPPGMPPPPPAYDNIAFEHGPNLFPPPPPYSVEDTEKVGTAEELQSTTVSVITSESLPRRLSSPSGNFPSAVYVP